MNIDKTLNITKPYIEWLNNGKARQQNALIAKLNQDNLSHEQLDKSLRLLGLRLLTTNELVCLIPTTDLLDQDKILKNIPANRMFDADLQTYWSVGSTNDVAKQRFIEADGLQAQIAVCEHQQSGRGRRGNTWVSPLGCNIYFSIAQTIKSVNAPLSLETAVMALEALATLGVEGVQIKWPNDLVFQSEKIGGILVEIFQHNHQPFAVVGLGINLAKSHDVDIEQPWTDIETLSGIKVDRNILVAELSLRMNDMLKKWSTETSEQRLGLWQQYNRDFNKPIKLLQDNKTIAQGICKGIDSTGRLLISSDGNIQSFVIGEISLRQQ